MVKFIKGNEAIVVGALYAGCDVYFGYPITPASEIAHSAAEWFPAAGRTFVQAECETGAAYMVYGAGACGVSSMTATSGPGMSLMQEALSYLAGSEIPGVFVNVMRAGPGLGNVYPEQADYNQSVKSGGHGNYHCIVLAPGTVQEMCDLTIRAFELTFKYRMPAIVLTDGLLGQMMENITLPERELKAPDTKSWATQGTAETRENLVKSIFLDAPAQEQHNVNLEAKYRTAQMEASAELYRCDDAEVLLIAYGSSSRMARTAVDRSREAGKKVGLFRPTTLAPFPAELLAKTAAGKRLIVVEMSNGQFCDDVQLYLAKQGAPSAVELANRMGGVVITVDEILARINS